MLRQVPGQATLGSVSQFMATMQESWVGLDARCGTRSGSKGIQEKEQI